MKRLSNIFEQIVSMDNLRAAYKKAVKGKASFVSVQKFKQDIEGGLQSIRQMLINGEFKTSKYFSRIIFEPKMRTIYILPFKPDRIVQHAIINVLGPYWTKLFIRDTYACIEGRGIHSGSRRCMQFVKRNKYCLKLDISKFYPSINQDILFGIIKRKLKDKRTLELLHDIVYSFPSTTNAPIGNLTSQWFGNLYLNELDQFVKHRLRCHDYVRYCDDFILFSNSKQYLSNCLVAIKKFLEHHLALRLSKEDLFRTSRGLDFLGYRHFNNYILLRKRTARALIRKLQLMPIWVAGRFRTLEYCLSLLASANGWIKHANASNFRRRFSILELTQHVKMLINTYQR